MAVAVAVAGAAALFAPAPVPELEDALVEIVETVGRPVLEIETAEVNELLTNVALVVEFGGAKLSPT